MPKIIRILNKIPPFVSLVIPCFNESKRLFRLESALVAFQTTWAKSFEVIVVDDGSKDDTANCAEQILGKLLQKADFQVISLPENQGKGGALRAGVLAASGNYILTLDADMAAHPLLLEQWFQSSMPSHQEIWIGSRAHKDSVIKAKSHRKITGSIYNLLVRLVTPIKESDTQCGFKLYPNQVGKVLFESLLLRGWAHDIELLYKAHYLGMTIKSMPVVWEHVEDEKIAVLQDGIKMARQTIYLSFLFRFNRTFRRNLLKMKQSQEKVNVQVSANGDI